MIRPTLNVRSVVSHWADLRVRLGEFTAARIVLGIHRGADPKLVTLSAVHELGSSTVPARSWLAPAIRENRRRIAASLAEMTSSAIRGHSGDGALRELGDWVAGRIRARILSTHLPPPLQPKTIAAKSRSGASDPTRPLVRTGHFVDSISAKVER